jgi:hypothetical protein
MYAWQKNYIADVSGRASYHWFLAAQIALAQILQVFTGVADLEADKTACTR